MSGMNTGLEGMGRKYDTAVFETHKLSNGIKVWLQKPPILTDEEGILIVFLPGVGSQLDPPHLHGIAHFFEHIPFRGTKNKPSTEAVNKPINMLGGGLNANTSYQRTVYFCTLDKENFDLAASTIFELVTQPMLSPEHCAIERGAIANEYRMRYANGASFARRHVLVAVYGDHPLNHDVLGELPVIDAMSVDDLMVFYKAHYHAGNIQIICGGAFAEIDGVVEKLDQVFGNLASGPVAPNPLHIQDLPFGKSGRVLITDPACGRDSLSIVHLMPLVDRREGVAMYVLCNYLSGSMTAPLIDELRVKRGLVYEFNSLAMSSMAGMTKIGLACATPSKNFEEVSDIYRRVLKNLSKDDLIEYQRSVQRSRKTSFKHPISVCENAVEEVTVYGQTFSYKEEEQIDDDVTLDQVFRWRDYLLKAEPFVLEIKTS